MKVYNYVCMSALGMNGSLVCTDYSVGSGTCLTGRHLNTDLGLELNPTLGNESR